MIRGQNPLELFLYHILIDYLLKNESFITIRSKNVDLRLLNKQKINKETKYWQIINIIIPITTALAVKIFLIT